MWTNGKRRAVLLALVPAVLITSAVAFVVLRCVGWPVGSGPPIEFTVTLAWNGEQASIPAPVRYPRPADIHVGRFPWLRSRGSMRDFTAIDSQGRRYVAGMRGVAIDPRNPQGRQIPRITYVKRYDPNWWLESSTQYSFGFEGPIEWYNRHPNGEKNIQVFKTPIGLGITFHDAQGQTYKEWLVNKHGQVYQERVRQGQLSVATHDLEELKTSTEVPWSKALREFMEYDPGRNPP